MSDPSYRSTRRNQGQLLKAAADIRALNELGVLMDMDTYGELLEREPPTKKDARRFVETIIKMSSPFKMMDFALDSDSSGMGLPATGFPIIYNLFEGIQRGNLVHNRFEGNQIKPLRMTFNMEIRGSNAGSALVRVMVLQWLGPIVSTAGVVSSPIYSDILNYVNAASIETLTCDKNWTNKDLINVIFDGLWHVNGYDGANSGITNSKDRIPIVIERDLENKCNNVCWQDSAGGSSIYDPYKGAFLCLVQDNLGATAQRTDYSFSARTVYYNQ